MPSTTLRALHILIYLVFLTTHIKYYRNLAEKETGRDVKLLAQSYAVIITTTKYIYIPKTRHTPLLVFSIEPLSQGDIDTYNLQISLLQGFQDGGRALEMITRLLAICPCCTQTRRYISLDIIPFSPLNYKNIHSHYKIPRK